MNDEAATDRAFQASVRAYQNSLEGVSEEEIEAQRERCTADMDGLTDYLAADAMTKPVEHFLFRAYLRRDDARTLDLIGTLEPAQLLALAMQCPHLGELCMYELRDRWLKHNGWNV